MAMLTKIVPPFAVLMFPLAFSSSPTLAPATTYIVCMYRSTHRACSPSATFSHFIDLSVRLHSKELTKVTCRATRSMWRKRVFTLHFSGGSPSVATSLVPMIAITFCFRSAALSEFVCDPWGRRCGPWLSRLRCHFAYWSMRKPKSPCQTKFLDIVLIFYLCAMSHLTL